MRKLLPFALAGLAALSFSAFAADTPAKRDTSGSTPSAAENSRHDNPNAGGANAATTGVDKSATVQGDASAGADKPVKKKHKAKKASKDKASSGSSSAVKKDRAGSASSGSSMPEQKTGATTGQPGTTSAVDDSRKQK
jgi:hypothetical protein